MKSYKYREVSCFDSLLEIQSEESDMKKDKPNSMQIIFKQKSHFENLRNKFQCERYV